MIQSAANTPSTAVAMLNALSGANPGTADEIPVFEAFSDLLAQQNEAPGLNGVAGPALAGGTAAFGKAAKPGKDLPPALPPAGAGELTAELPVKGLPGLGRSEEERPDPSMLAPTLPSAVAAVSPDALPPVDPDAVFPAERQRPPVAAQGLQHRQFPSLPETASDRAVSRTAQPAVSELVDAGDAAIEPVPEPAPNSKARNEEVRLNLAIVRPASARPDQPTAPRWLAVDEHQAASEAPSTAVSAAASQATGTPPPQTGASAIRPHDFAALIERLATAREAMAPQSVAITVAHSDFGQVRLRFRKEDSGLTVAMSSPDPGFARAATAMPPPVIAAPASDQAALSQQRGDQAQHQAQAHADGSDHSAHSRDGSSGRRHSQQQGHALHPDGEPGRPRRSGIFA